MSLSRSNSTGSRDSETQTEHPYLLALNNEQRTALKELRAWCVQNDVYWNNENDSNTNDDVTLIRYLKARSWKVSAAAKQYSATVAWRRRIDLKRLYENADIEQFEAVSRLMPQWTGRRTRKGVPLFVYSVAKTRPEDLLSTSKADPSLSSVFLPAEYSTRFIQPVCAALHSQAAMPVLTHIIDLNGVGVKHFWNLRSHLQKAAGMATSHYPESVDKIFIVGAPSFFPTIWGYITKWFDPAITSKISVLSASNTEEILSSYVDPRDLPISFGGQLEWNYGDPPAFDAKIESLLNSSGHDWMAGPLVFQSDRSQGISFPSGTILAVGLQKDMTPRRTVVAALASC